MGGGACNASREHNRTDVERTGVGGAGVIRVAKQGASGLKNK